MLDWLNDLIRAPASCVIRVGGQELSDLYYCLVEVSAVLNPAGRAQRFAYNLRGLGGSAPGEGPLTIEFLVDALIELLDHLEVERACVVGLSMGGYVALRAVDRHPERVRGLVLADTRAGADDNAGRVRRADAIRAIHWAAAHRVHMHWG